MKGVIFNVFEEVVRREHGPDVWDDLLDETGLAGAYTSLGNYSDAEIAALADAAGSRFCMTRGEILRWFGRRAMPVLKETYPALFESHPSARDFTLAVNSMIHPEVRKLYPGADCPYFHFRPGENGAVFMDYDSPRKMCDLAHGFMEGAAELFGATVEITHHDCMKHGGERCTMEVRWPA